jgi:hypothetical protein
MINEGVRFKKPGLSAIFVQIFFLVTRVLKKSGRLLYLKLQSTKKTLFQSKYVIHIRLDIDSILFVIQAVKF